MAHKQVPVRKYNNLVTVCAELLTRQTMSERIESLQLKLNDLKEHSVSFIDFKNLLLQEIDIINFYEEIHAEANEIRQRRAQQVLPDD